jgi:poly-gamma-glutamate synthesis protein (capsule biosynthesis protein)
LYVPVTNRYSILDNISKTELISSLNSQKLGKHSLIWNKDTDEFLRSKYSFGVGQTVYSNEQIIKKIVDGESIIAIIPFDQLNPTFKVLNLDNTNPILEEESLTSYPLTDSYWYSSENEYSQNVETILKTVSPKNNYDFNNISSIYLTGSSLVGADEYNVNIVGGKKADYMISNLSTIISKNDILHTSNEVSIYASCIQQISSTYLCSRESGFLPFKTLGVDVVGVTGNHIMDFGYDTFIDTLDWYLENKVGYFGGGKDQNDSHKARVVNINNLRVAFIGYNFIPPYSYYSSGSRGGSANVSLKFMKDDIETAKRVSDIVVVDMNWGDELQNRVDNTQRENAKYAIEYGATIVNGVNSYKPLGFDTSIDSSTFYGLGGFLNPQASSGLIVKHIFYEKKYIGYDLIPISYGKDKIIVVDKDKAKSDKLINLYKQSQLIYDKN